MSQNIFFKALQFVFIDLVGEILYFPIWWYTVGLGKAWRLCLANTKDSADSLGVFIWWKNLFKPMFAQYDWQGRLISFFMRVVQIIFRTLAWLVWLLIIWLWLIIWLLLPLYIFYQLFSIWQSGEQIFLIQLNKLGLADIFKNF